MGIADITLITPPESAPPLEAALATNPALTSLPLPRPEILAPKDLAQTTGTGELLRLEEVQRCITGDFVVVPCDLISEMDGSLVLQQWMTLNPLETSGGTDKWKGGLSVFYPTYGLEGISTKKDETDFLATVPLPSPPVPPPNGSLRSNIEEIVLNMPSDTLNDKLEEDKGFLRLRQSLLQKHGRVKMHMKHRDAHFYVFPKWLKDFAARNERFESISEDMLGWWAKAGWQEGLSQKFGLEEALGGKQEGSADVDGAADEDEIDPSTLSTTRVSRPVQPSKTLFASRVRTAASPPKPSLPPLLAYVQPAPSLKDPQPLIRRIDTSAQVLTVSLHLARKSLESNLSHEHKIHPTATLSQQARVSQEDSLVAENVRIGFRANLKESVIGANCEIGANVRLTRCLLMEGVTVGEGVVMVGCIVGRRARVEGTKPSQLATASREGSAESAAKPKGKKGASGGGEEEGRTKLTDCEVAPNFVVEAGTEAKGEKLMEFDTEEDMDRFDDEEDEGVDAGDVEGDEDDH